MSDENWIKGFIERHTKESAGIPKFMLDAYAPSLKENETRAKLLERAYRTHRAQMIKLGEK